MVRTRSRERESFDCPNCGAEVPGQRLACPECGSDAETGWAEDADKWAADVPDGYSQEEEFDYDEFVSKEFPEHLTGSRRWLRKKMLVKILWALVCLLLFIVAVLGR